MTIYNRYYSAFEKGFIANCTLGVLVQSCMGSVAVMAILTHGTGLLQMLQLFLIVACCMVFNGAVLSQQKAKVVFSSLLISLIASVVLSIINFN